MYYMPIKIFPMPHKQNRNSIIFTIIAEILVHLSANNNLSWIDTSTYNLCLIDIVKKQTRLSSY